MDRGKARTDKRTPGWTEVRPPGLAGVRIGPIGVLKFGHW